MVLWKMDAAGQPVRQIELRDAIAAAVIAPQRNLRLLAFHLGFCGFAVRVVLLTARQCCRRRRRNSPALSRGIFRQEIPIVSGFEAKLAAKWQSMPDLRRDLAMMAREKVAPRDLREG